MNNNNLTPTEISKSVKKITNTYLHFKEIGTN